MYSDKLKLGIFTILLTAFVAYSLWIYVNLPVKKYTSSAIVTKGKLVWQQYNCAACHQLYGLGGYIGPDLTNVYSKGGVAYITMFISNGTTVMPNFHLSENEKQAIIAYLKNVNATGSADARTFRILANGTIEQ